jgi:cytochrome c5
MAVVNYMVRSFLTSLLAVAVTATIAAGDEPNRGEQIFKTQCAKCHGAHGEGTKQHRDPLIGDRSVAELAKLIEKSMPEDDPGKCTGDDAQAAAEYIYGEFYSPLARARNRPARIDLARLTVRQYQNAVTDLIGSFRGDPAWGEKRGLHGMYFKGRQLRDSDIVIDRIDPTVAFDFGQSSPDPDKLDLQHFSIRWDGSVLAPDTGDYDFIVHTEHAMRLWVNDQRQPLIDAWVKSGSDTEYRGSIHLLGGRVYSLRLEFSRAIQGVSDADKFKPKALSPNTSIILKWRRPHLVDEVIPERCLSPKTAPEVFVVQTPFPPDDRSVGYERGTSVSKAWDQATTDGAIEVADYVTSHLPELAGIKENAPDRSKRLREFCVRFARRAFRRPLSDEQIARYVDHQFDAGENDAAVKRVVLLVLKSPRFLYREVAPEKEDEIYDIASRLSFGLWDSLPDKDLLQVAKDGKLTNPEEVSRQAARMVSDLRAHSKLREFFLQWLKVDQNAELSKDNAQYPDFTATVATDLRTSLELFVDEVLWSEQSDFRQLFTSDSVPMNCCLKKFYGIDPPETESSAATVDDSAYADVALEPDHRSGVLTHPYLLATFAHATTSSPIHRGVFISRNLLGRALKPPPEAMTPLSPDLHPDLTTRERVALQTQSESCMVCHATINPLGFTLENFDAVGRFRAEEKGKPIDASGAYQARSGEMEKFNGIHELAEFLADSDETHQAFVEQLFHYLVKQPVLAYGPDRLAKLDESFKNNQFNMRKLAAEIVAGTALNR